MDLGGDSSRLYFYDPIHYLQSFPLYALAPSGYGAEVTAYYFIPFVGLILALKKIVLSSYLVITLFNSFALVTAFLSIYGIITSFLKEESVDKNEMIAVDLAGIICGFFYTFSPLLINVGWDKALVTHNQFFLNPLLFFLLLKYILKRKTIFAFLALLISFIFAPSFFPSPYFFSFFPLAVLYLLLFGLFFKRKHISFKQISLFVFFFIAIHIFHLFPFMSNIFLPGSSLYESTFTDYGKFDRGLNSFLAGVSSIKPSYNVFGILQGDTRWVTNLWAIFPILTVFGLLRIEKRSRIFTYNFLLLILFLLLSMYLATANFTKIGLKVYELLFNIPGFSMFRNHYGQFAHPFIFFYSLPLGFALFLLFSSVKIYLNKIAIFACLIFTIVVVSNPFIKGEMINRVLNKGSQHEVTIPFRMDPVYENVLENVRKDPIDGKYLLFPLDDYGYQILSGIDGGAYQGPSTIAYLGEKNQFSGQAGPFGQTLTHLVVERDYEGINNLLTLHNIRHIFYNSDPNIYDDTFTGYPNAYVRKFMPLTQGLYKDFIDLISVKKKQDFGELYHVYEVDDNYYVPHIYVAKKTYHTSIESPQSYITPFSFSEDKRVAIFADRDLSALDTSTFDGMYVQAKNKTPIIDFFSKQRDFFTISSSVSQELYTLIHPFVVLPEKLANEEANVLRRVYFDKGAYAAEKIIKNLERENSLSAWEEGLKQYTDMIVNLTDEINNQNNALYSSVINKMKLRTIVISNKNKLHATVIRNRSFSDVQKAAVARLIDQSFDILNSNLRTENSFETSLHLLLNIPQAETYTVFVEAGRIKNSNKVEFSLDNKILIPQSIEKNGWFSFNNLSLEKTDVDFSFIFPYELDFADSAFINLLREPATVPYLVNMKTEGLMFQYIQNVIADFANIKPYTTYIVSFDYQVRNGPTVGVWKTYKAVIEIGNNATSAYMVVLGDQRNPQDAVDPFFQASDIQLKNLSVASLSYPRVIARKEKPREQLHTPAITFTKINPTKYEVKVSGVKYPYTLVFLDQFSKNWKVFLKTKGERDEVIGATYFGGEIKEGMHRNSFLDVKSFETWGKSSLADNRHYIVNGYANAWYIEPKDTQGLTEYTLILELITQRSIYPLLLISFTAVGICLALFVKALWKNKQT